MALSYFIEVPPAPIPAKKGPPLRYVIRDVPSEIGELRGLVERCLARNSRLLLWHPGLTEPVRLMGLWPGGNLAIRQLPEDPIGSLDPAEVVTWGKRESEAA